ncbi:MAG: alpha/beta hydrolase [Chthoniobacterales bacterium]
MKSVARFVTGGLAFIVAGLVGVRAAAQYRTATRTRVASPDAINSVEKIHLGGVDQWLHIRARNHSLPVLLFLHGGPGFSEMPFDHVNAELAEDFIVVQWDQRGTGKSYRPSLDAKTLTVDRIVADALELTDSLRARFGQRKILLVGHSWGTIIGLRAAARHPELFHAYVGISQVADPPESERMMYRETLARAEQSGASEGEAALRAIGLPPYRSVEDYQTMNRWIHHFNDAEYREMSPARFGALAFASPVYSWLDFFRLWRGFRFSFAHLWREAFATNFPAQIPHLDLPVYFFLGRHDHTSTVSAEMAEKYWEMLDAPQGKELVWFENSGHWPQLNEPQKYRAQLRAIARTIPHE